MKALEERGKSEADLARLKGENEAIHEQLARLKLDLAQRQERISFLGMHTFT